MRDVLEELFAEQEELREEGAQIFEEIGLPRRRAGTESAEEGETGSEAAALSSEQIWQEWEPSLPPEGEDTPASALERGGAGGAWAALRPGGAAVRQRTGGAGPSAAVRPAVETAAAAEPFQRASAGTEALDQAIRRQAAAVAYQGARPAAAPAQEPPGRSGEAIPILADWDRAVERDARRYDGPFPLY